MLRGPRWLAVFRIRWDRTILLNSGFRCDYDSDVTTETTYLERIDSARNMARYYRLSVVETLFGEWAMVREWGRIGQRGQSREHLCVSESQAVGLLQAHHAQRLRRGYK